MALPVQETRRLSAGYARHPGSQPVERASAGEQREPVRDAPLLNDRPAATRQTSITVTSIGRPLGGPKNGPVAVPRARTRIQIR